MSWLIEFIICFVVISTFGPLGLIAVIVYYLCRNKK